MYGWSGLGIARYANPTVDDFGGRTHTQSQFDVVAARTGEFEDKLGHDLSVVSDDSIDVLPVVEGPVYLLGQKIGPVVTSSLPPDSPPFATPAFTLSDIPWWGWLGAAGVGFWAFKGGKR